MALMTGKVISRAMEVEKVLGLSLWIEAPHFSFSLSGVLFAPYF